MLPPATDILRMPPLVPVAIREHVEWAAAAASGAPLQEEPHPRRRVATDASASGVILPALTGGSA
ncbi:MAG TPA: hypothetical protein VFG92_04885 [Agromyces sp.]|nr:hypothetical protein [Agromyces sp.]